MEQYTPTEQEVVTGKAYAVLGYLGILVLVPLLAAKDNRYARYHANQGLLLLIVEIIASVLAWLPVVGFVGTILGVVCFVFMILGMINAAKGQCKPLPIIGNFSLLQV